MNWSKYQLAIFEAVEHTTDSLLIEAVAGGSKTTVIVESCNRLPSGLSVAMLAFNKEIQLTLEKRITRPNTTCKTFHAIGLGTWQGFCGVGVRVESGKTQQIIRDSLSWDERRRYPGLGKLVGLAKQHGLVPGGLRRLQGAFVAQNDPTTPSEAQETLSEAPRWSGVALESLPETQEGASLQGLLPDTNATWTGLCDTYGVDTEEVSFDLAREILAESLRISHDTCDYDDMLYLPVVTQAPFQRFDVVFVDEVQDLNEIQIEMVSRMVKTGGRVIAVGDSKQSIYRFRGAHSEAMAELARRFQCKPLPLSISYRCPRAVVKRAQTWVPVIESHEEAAEGLVVDYPEVWRLSEFRPSDVLLCRLTRPLVETAFRLIRARIPCRVLGRDIGAGLVALVRKGKLHESRSVKDYAEWLSKYEKREKDKFREKEEFAKIGLLEDRLATLRVFMDDLEEKATVGQLIQEIEALFKDDGAAGKVSLATVHKAKGLEFPRVFILNAHELMPCPWSSDMQEETNLMYVACTRAQQELYYLRTDDIRE